jgi:RNA polymerase sigma-70 factor (ECF subfamily)
VHSATAPVQKNEAVSLSILGRWLGTSRKNDKSDEVRLGTAASNGDRRAFDMLVSIHEAGLRGFIARRVQPSVVDDVLQDVWLAAWNSLKSFRGRSRFKAWLYQIAIHKCADVQRVKSLPTVPIHEPHIEAVLPGISFQASSDDRHDVGIALLTLPDAQREVLELYYYADLTLAEIAQALGRNLNTVKYHFYKAHAAVGEHLNDREDGANQNAQGKKVVFPGRNH